MPFATANDLNIYYEIHGTGIPLILIGGFTTSCLIWKEYLPSLVKKYQVLIFDNRGGGQTDAPEIPYSIKMMSEDTAALMDALQIPSAHIVGHSMGGAILQQLCIDHPEKVKKAMICSSAAFFPRVVIAQIEASSKLFQAGINPELILESILPWVFSNEFLSDPENIKKSLYNLMHDPYPQTPAGFEGQAQALADVDLREDVKKILHKTVVVCGEEDIYTPLSCSQFLAENIPQAELKIIPKQAHLFNMEKPHELISLILKNFSS